MRISRNGRWKSLPFCCLILLAGCATYQPSTTVKAAAALPLTVDELATRELGPDDALLIGAGDIAQCGSQLKQAQETADIIQKKFPKATVFAAGDDAYTNGTDPEFKKCYDPTWGAFRKRTRPAPGNHDYGIYLSPPRNDLKPYFAYYGGDAGPANLGYYSYDLGGWHIVSLNSMAGQRGAPSMAAQVEWLKKDLAGNEKKCVLAYWHHPLFSSGDHGNNSVSKPIWDVLLLHKAEVIINGHDHHYERFALQDSAGKATPDGIREFIAGTGGGDARGIRTVKKNSEKRLGHVYGVLLMTLHPNGYEWHFIKAKGEGSVEDQGGGECH